jgi:hypothetical protein
MAGEGTDYVSASRPLILLNSKAFPVPRFFRDTRQSFIDIIAINRDNSGGCSEQPGENKQQGSKTRETNMGTLHRLENDSLRMLRAVSASSCITFGSDIPHSKLGTVGFRRVGYADIPCVEFVATTKDAREFVPQARQHMLRAIVNAGLDPHAVCDLTVVIDERRSRRAKFTDVNPSSASCGKNKMGYRAEFRLEIARDHAREFESTLPRSWGAF